MTSLDTLLASLPQRGQVTWMGVRAARREPLVTVEEVDVRIGTGLTGDRFSGNAASTRQVTFIQAEHLDVVASVMGLSAIDPALLRRNVAVRGINLLSLIGAHFQIGPVVFEGTGRCHPCSRMEEYLGPGGYNAMRGHGGLTARVLQPGVMRIGDSVQLIRPGKLGNEERE